MREGASLSENQPIGTERCRFSTERLTECRSSFSVLRQAIYPTGKRLGNNDVKKKPIGTQRDHLSTAPLTRCRFLSNLGLVVYPISKRLENHVKSSQQDLSDLRLVVYPISKRLENHVKLSQQELREVVPVQHSRRDVDPFFFFFWTRCRSLSDSGLVAYPLYRQTGKNQCCISLHIGPFIQRSESGFSGPVSYVSGNHLTVR